MENCTGVLGLGGAGKSGQLPVFCYLNQRPIQLPGVSPSQGAQTGLNERGVDYQAGEIFQVIPGDLPDCTIYQPK